MLAIASGMLTALPHTGLKTETILTSKRALVLLHSPLCTNAGV